ncbi:hypothetical protein QAD02_021731 [Eretmocerus hayati]|uniref:Uncharacterized protein n=1 Tax=Eretmocerus hayati TaxID=131215 RepID=A0ACC2PS51_9HYME|nr:hypothetical protein QAD02_021731 [Eretmocerus hayati]
MILGTEEQSLVVDTIVMANLGYFQFKANPGEWILKLRPGRSSEIYDIISIHGSEVMKKEDSIKILISSLKSDVLKVRVKKKMDKVHMDLLTEDEGRSGIWDSITR